MSWVNNWIFQKKKEEGEKRRKNICNNSANKCFFFFLIKQDNKSTFQFQYQNPGLKKKTSDCD